MKTIARYSVYFFLYKENIWIINNMFFFNKYNHDNEKITKNRSETKQWLYPTNKHNIIYVKKI